MKKDSVSEAATKIVDETAQGVLNHLMANEIGTPRHLSIERAEQLINQTLHQETRALAESRLALEVENKRLRKALGFYAEIKNWNGDYHLAGIQSSRLDSGKIARATLSQPTPTTGILELAAAAYTYVQMGKCTNYDIGYQKDYGAMGMFMSEKAEALPQDTKEILERILG